MNEKEAQIERFGVNDANKKTFLSEFYGKKEENQRSQKKQQKSHFGLKKEQNDQEINMTIEEESMKYVLSFNPSQNLEVTSEAESSQIRKKSLKSKTSRAEISENDPLKKKSSSNSTSVFRQSKSQNQSKRDSQNQTNGRCRSISLKYSKSGVSVETTSGYNYFGKSGNQFK